MKASSGVRTGSVVCTVALLLSAGVGAIAGAPAGDDLLIVDCALPGQIRQLGRSTTYVAPRQPQRTTALDCRIRGGEYVVHDRASLKTSLAVWLETAQSGDAEAQTMVGEIFERGLGASPDYQAAALWYRRAAEAGSTRAQVNLGHLYEKGLGVPADPAEALRWYRLAAGLPQAIELETVPDVAPLLAARDRAIAELRQQIGALEQQAAELEAELARARQALDEARQATGNAQVSDQRAASLEQALARSVAALRDREAELAARSLEFAERLAAEQAAREPAQAPAPLTPVVVPAAGLLAGPDIVLIEPVLGATRGLVKVSVPAPAELQRVVGRVAAPAGVLSVTVNGEPVEVNPAGVFMTEVRVRGAQADVAVTAIDQQGKRADLNFALARQAPAEAPAVAATTPLAPLPGSSYALLIGNDDYVHLPRLNTPIADVDRIAAVLSGRYGFQVRTLHNATRYDTLSALNDLRGRLTSDDRLLLYYAGHGELDEANMRGHWLPVDAEPDNTANWLSNVDITDILNVIRARQVLLVVDSCYSGTLTRSSLTRLEVGLKPEEQATWLKLMASKRARVVLTSGGLAPVLDFGGGAHSVFARSFIEALEANADVLLGRSLYQAVAARVAHAAAGFDFEQIPQYAPISRAGHESGDFILQPRL
ncbi:MAG: caspase family protein [Pseudomonadales bacterium]